MASFECALFNLDNFTWPWKNVSVVVFPQLQLLVIFTQSSHCCPPPSHALVCPHLPLLGNKTVLQPSVTHLFFVCLLNEHSRPWCWGYTYRCGHHTVMETRHQHCGHLMECPVYVYITLIHKKTKGINNKQRTIVTFVQKSASSS